MGKALSVGTPKGPSRPVLWPQLSCILVFLGYLLYFMARRQIIFEVGQPGFGERNQD